MAFSIFSFFVSLFLSSFISSFFGSFFLLFFFFLYFFFLSFVALALSLHLPLDFVIPCAMMAGSEHEGDAMKLYSEMWMSAVDNMLKRGFGVEDIGLKMRCHPDKVRAYVRCLRQIGTLRAWWPRSIS